MNTLLEMWYAEIIFPSRQDRKRGLARIVNFYDTDKSHAGMASLTPYEKLRYFFFDPLATR